MQTIILVERLLAKGFGEYRGVLEMKKNSIYTNKIRVYNIYWFGFLTLF
jgi:hypothetical protein